MGLLLLRVGVSDDDGAGDYVAGGVFDGALQAGTELSERYCDAVGGMVFESRMTKAIRGKVNVPAASSTTVIWQV